MLHVKEEFVLENLSSSSQRHGPSRATKLLAKLQNWPQSECLQIPHRSDATTFPSTTACLVDHQAKLEQHTTSWACPRKAELQADAGLYSPVHLGCGRRSADMRIPEMDFWPTDHPVVQQMSIYRSQKCQAVNTSHKQSQYPLVHLGSSVSPSG
ncbi:uncharacterized protein BDW70DRAFT_125744 [Aspergillus foveolatus]|uniref:uncharacterized protein n=1 Tax=Aspergillus foveolatus TaxID=210207 RepID=UPI003CCD2FCD